MTENNQTSEIEPVKDIQTGEATYCPEDNKLRLYVGRVPREEFLELRADGWKSTPKQDCDFVATWTPQREDTALAYGEGFIGDEDQGPDERAADRAERFAGYRDKRTQEALGHADSYESGPSAHGYQSKAKAVRAADRHDKQAARALTQWSKAEYWTSRTAGVISNALYLSRPDVRMGRIKGLETDLRRYEASPEYYGRWVSHTQLRIAYENQMLEAVGGRASVVEMEKGGLYGGYVISRVVKSKASGLVTSVKVIAGEREVLHNIERSKAGQYEAPTEESLIALKEFTKARAEKAKEANAGKPKLINPTNEDAERLQAIWNKNASERSMKGAYSNGKDQTEPQTVLEMTQAQYSARSGCPYSHFKTIFISEGGKETRRHYYETVQSEAVCKIRETRGSGGYTWNAHRVIVITDKPQKPLPVSVWEQVEAEKVEA